MNLKSTNKNYWTPVPEQHYKKTYLVRKAQEIEAEEEIVRFEREADLYPSPTSEMSYSQDVDAEG
jgi:hypothetical protein